MSRVFSHFCAVCLRSRNRRHAETRPENAGGTRREQPTAECLLPLKTALSGIFPVTLYLKWYKPIVQAVVGAERTEIQNKPFELAARRNHDHPSSVLHVREDRRKQMGGLSWPAASRVHRRGCTRCSRVEELSTRVPPPAPHSQSQGRSVRPPARSLTAPRELWPAGPGMGNSSRKEGEEEEEEEDGGAAGEKKKKEEEEEEEEELPLGVDELLDSGDPVLDLSYRKFRRLPARVCGLEHLQKLYLCGNRLRGLPDTLAQLQGLRILALDFNKVEDVPPAVLQLANLTRLYLGSNRLMELPPELRNLQSLRCLWVESNYFQRFPRQLYDLPHLRSLQLGDNRLRSLPADLWRMEALRGLWLYGNRFREFPRVLLRMEGLEILDLDRNQISQFPSLTHLPALRLLSYDHNPVKGPPKVGEEVLLVGEGAEEALEARAQKKEARRRAAEKEAEEEAAGATAGGGGGGGGRGGADGPIIHGILKNSGSVPSQPPNGVPGEMADGLADDPEAEEEEEEEEESQESQGKGEGVECDRTLVEYDEVELEYDEEGVGYEREELVCEGEGFDQEGTELVYDRAEMDYEYEEEGEEFDDRERQGRGA
ncbi:hypothetical protein COCON_G00110620 [Conger conger]|uniref:Disease resistance R13L4/SHOC-2-like LRR domain-containing protein n=1 Tax=Conger conger TaxID=82655 RepID=A0A9Q1HZF1_CONCO|nr:hypothetical protein COCON_G00110620 [Conger conger]